MPARHASHAFGLSHCIVAPENVEPVLAALLNADETAFVCGQLQAA